MSTSLATFDSRALGELSGAMPGSPAYEKATLAFWSALGVTVDEVEGTVALADSLTGQTFATMTRKAFRLFTEASAILLFDGEANALETESARVALFG